MRTVPSPDDVDLDLKLLNAITRFFYCLPATCCRRIGGYFIIPGACLGFSGKYKVPKHSVHIPSISLPMYEMSAMVPYQKISCMVPAKNVI